jgi:hypothetical protein
VKKNLARLEYELVKLKQEIRRIKPKPESIPHPEVDGVIETALKADPTARNSVNSNSPPPPNTVSPASIPAPVGINTTSPAETTCELFIKSKIKHLKCLILFYCVISI